MKASASWRVGPLVFYRITRDHGREVGPFEVDVDCYGLERERGFGVQWVDGADVVGVSMVRRRRSADIGRDSD